MADNGFPQIVIGVDGSEVCAAAQVRAAAARNPSVHLRHRWSTGSPAAALVHAARGAAMVVVTSRSAGPLARVPLGSVGSYCTAHAECPVVIIPAQPIAPRRPHAEPVRDVIEELTS